MSRLRLTLACRDYDRVAALDTFLRDHHEQGLSPRRLQPEALFAPETLESFVI